MGWKFDTLIINDKLADFFSVNRQVTIIMTVM